MNQTETVFRDQPYYRERFVAMLQPMLDLFYTPRYPPGQGVYDEAWEIVAKNRTERQILLSLDWLKAEFRKDRVVSSLRDAREHAHAVEAKALAVTRNQARGGTDALLQDQPGASRQSRAYLACTRWCAREIAELGRQGKDIGHPERQAVHEYHARQFAAIDANDPEAVGRWIEWAEAERQVALARKGASHAA